MQYLKDVSGLQVNKGKKFNFIFKYRRDCKKPNLTIIEI